VGCFMERDGNDQGDDPGRGRIECTAELLKHGRLSNALRAARPCLVRTNEKYLAERKGFTRNGEGQRRLLLRVRVL
jgi:hypothetical protein